MTTPIKQLRPFQQFDLIIARVSRHCININITTGEIMSYYYILIDEQVKFNTLFATNKLYLLTNYITFEILHMTIVLIVLSIWRSMNIFMQSSNYEMLIYYHPWFKLARYTRSRNSMSINTWKHTTSNKILCGLVRLTQATTFTVVTDEVSSTTKIYRLDSKSMFSYQVITT